MKRRIIVALLATLAASCYSPIAPSVQSTQPDAVRPNSGRSPLPGDYTAAPVGAVVMP
jgi:hypothetical protein